MKREETEGPREVGRPTSSPGGAEAATEGEREVEAGNCGGARELRTRGDG